MSFPPRAVTVIALIQIGVTAIGLLLTRSFKKLFDRTDLSEILYQLALPSLMLSWGWLLFAVPVAWTAWPVVSSRYQPDQAAFSRGHFWIGCGLLVLLFWVSSHSVLLQIAALTPR